MQHRHNSPTLAGFRRGAINIAVATALPAATVYAEEIKELPTAQASAQSEDNYKIDESSSQKYTQPLLNTAKTITVIPESVMKDRNVDSLRDALRNVTGISMAAGEGGTPTGDQMSIRGFSANNDILIDSVRDIAGYTRDIYNIEAVEVAKGPGSAVYGRGSTGGSINLTTKTAKLDDFHDVDLRLGSENDYRAKLDSNTQIGHSSALRVNALSDDVDVAGRDEVYNAKNAIAVSFATGLNTSTRFNVNAEYQTQDNLPDYGIAWVPNYSGRDDRSLHADIADYEGEAPPVDFSNFYGSVDRDFEEIKAQSITAKFEKDLNTSTILSILARTGSVERKSIVNAPRFNYETISDADTGEDVRIYGEGAEISLGGEKTRDTKNSLNIIQADLLGHYETNNISHDIVLGIELAQEKFQRWNYTAVVEDNLQDLNVDLYRPNNQVAYTGRYARTGADQEATGDTTALYAFDTVTLNPQWQISAGLRYDIFSTEYFYQQDEPEDPNAKVEAEDQTLSWNIAAVFKPSATSSIYFGLGNSFSPSAEDLTTSGSETSNLNELEPEESLSYELGAKWALFDDRLYANAALFRTEKTNARTDNPSLDVGSSFDTLNGEQRVDGLELSAAGNLNKQLSITAAYTFQQSKVVSAEGDDAAQEGNALPRTPEHSMSLWALYELNDKFSFGAGAQYLDERYNSSDPGGRERADAYLIFDMMAAYQITQKWGLQLNGTNLSNEAYVDQLGGGHFIPGEGRYITLSSSYSF